jgi:hypothetical protein
MAIGTDTCPFSGTRNFHRTGTEVFQQFIAVQYGSVSIHGAYGCIVQVLWCKSGTVPNLFHAAYPTKYSEVASLAFFLYDGESSVSIQAISDSVKPAITLDAEARVVFASAKYYLTYTTVRSGIFQTVAK